jgi:hypothetical protein
MGVDKYDEVKTSMMIKVWMYDKRFRKETDTRMHNRMIIRISNVEYRDVSRRYDAKFPSRITEFEFGTCTNSPQQDT